MAPSRRQRILPPYTPRVSDWQHAASRLVVVGLVLGFAVVYGLAIAILPQQFMSMLLLPVGLLALLALWMAPDLDSAYDASVRSLYLGLIFVTIVWPYYLALDVPGLPWITAGRLMQILLFTVAGLFFATSARARHEVADTISAVPLAFRLWLLTSIYVVLTMPLSGTEGFVEGAKLLIATLIVFLIGCFVFRDDRSVLRVGSLIVIAAAIVAFFALGEFLNGKPLWAGHLPSFLKVEEPRILRFLNGEMRTLDGRPRVGSSFGVPLFLGEFLGMAAVFCVHLMLKQSKVFRFFALLSLFIFILVCCYIANARSAFISLIGGLFGYYFVFAFNKYLRGRSGKDIFAPAFVLAIPATFLLVSAAVLFVGRIRVLVLGGGQHAFSDRARDVQWDTALQRALARPWGHGPGRATEEVGWANSGGLSIDSTQVWLAVDYGFVGLFLFAAGYLAMLVTTLRAAFGAEGEVERMALPAFGVMTAFLATRYGIASYMNIYIVFAMFALSATVLWRQRARGGLFQWAELRSLWSSRGIGTPAGAHVHRPLAPQT